MGQILVSCCNVCGAVKGPVNHWKGLIAFDNSTSLTIHSYDRAMELVSECRVDVSDVFLVCGDHCFTRALERWKNNIPLKGEFYVSRGPSSLGS